MAGHTDSAGNEVVDSDTDYAAAADSLHRPRVLIIEPNAVLAHQLNAVLQDLFEIAFARSAQAAIEAADKAKPDVVITEMQTTDASVSGFLHEFRSYAEWRDIPVVLYTFSLQVPAAVKHILAERFGVVAVLHKSHVSAAILIEQLKKLNLQRSA